MSRSNSDESERYQEILNPSLWTRLCEFWEGVKKSWLMMGYEHPVSDELVIVGMQEEMRAAEKRLRKTDGWANLTQRERDLLLLDAQISACETAIEEAARLRLRFALRYALEAKASFLLSRDALNTE